MSTVDNQELQELVIKANSMFNQLSRTSQYTTDFTTEELYEALDFPVGITYQDYYQRFKRQDIANRIVKAPVQGTWADQPKIYESLDTDTKFERDIDEVLVDLKLYSIFYRLDLMATLGRYAVLFLGTSDNAKPSIELTSVKDLLYVTPIPEDRAKIQTWVTDTKSPRYGLPLTYQITLNDGNHGGSPTETIIVHWSRLIHVAENKYNSEVYGIPYLEPVYNRLIGLDKLAGGSPEMYWRGARPGYTAQAEGNTIITPAQKEQLKDQLSSFVNNLQRWLYVQGMKIQALAPQVVTPEPHVDVQLKLISAATRIPMRILVGSERGELASSQDERAWLSCLEERRANVADALILRPFIDRMIELGIVSAPSTGEYFIEWDPLLVLSEKERAEIAKIKTETLKTYLESMGGSDIIPVEPFLSMLGFTEEEIELMLVVSKDDLAREDALREPKLDDETTIEETE